VRLQGGKFDEEELMMASTIEPDGAEQERSELHLRNWIWRPWYAKLWWSGVPVYWLGMLASLKIDVLAEIYHSAAGGYLNVFFFPPIVALTLSFGFLRLWLASLPTRDPDEIDDGPGWNDRRFGPSRMPRQFDPLDPASGPLWVGNTLNPTNPGYVNRAS
jgi:hypothetical protein